MRLSGETAAAARAVRPALLRAGSHTVIGSGLTDFGQSHTGPVKNILADRLPVTAAIGFLSWVVRLGPRPGPGDPARRPAGASYAALHQERIYPVAHAVPSLVVVILFYLVLVQFDPSPSRWLRTCVGILSLVVLMLPGTTALWLNGIRRVLGPRIRARGAGRGASRRSPSGAVTSCRTSSSPRAC